MKKKVLVYPCGTEIGLEIYRALRQSPHYEIYGGSSNADHGEYVYEKHISDLPFITDDSNEDEIKLFSETINEFGFDYIYPAMDGVLAVFSRYRDLLPAQVIAPDYSTASITRSKKKTYEVLKGIIPIPEIYDSNRIEQYPIFCKPDVGQGSVGAKVIFTKEELERHLTERQGTFCMEYLPGREYTVDCFTNNEGKLIYARGRERKRIKNGISVNTEFSYREEFAEYANAINSKLKQKGGWFFQLKEAGDGRLKLLEVSSRIAGTSAISRCSGVNLPLLTLDLYAGITINDVVINSYSVSMDRALENRYKIDLYYDTVYVDYDDTVVLNGNINIALISFLYKCVNEKKRIILLTKHDGDIYQELEKYRITAVFDEIIHIERGQEKWKYVSGNSIFIDDSYGERRAVSEKSGISVFDTAMIECLCSL